MFKIAIFATILAVVVFADHIDKDAQVKSLVNDVNPDGSYQYSFETSNGISQSESGNEASKQGSAAWVAPDGTPVRLSYVADENGYQPSSDLLPVAPEVPSYILRALEYIRTHPPKDEPLSKRF